MNFTYADLMPASPAVPIHRVNFRLPLTPFFIEPSTLASSRTRGFRGQDFFLQNKNTRKINANGSIDDEPICGFDAYQVFSSVDLDANDPDPSTGTRTRSYVFDSASNTVTLQTVETGKPAFGTTHTRTATTSKLGDAFRNPPTHVEITLSEAVNKTWLSGELQRWMSESEALRTETGGGLGTFSYAGQGATRSESDGYLGIVGGGEVQAAGPWYEGEPVGMVGDEGEQWNGKFSTWVNQVRRKNAPVLHRESSKNNGSVFPGAINQAVGASIYRNGYTETELTEPLGNVWRDERGVFTQAGALEGFPLSAAFPFEFQNLMWHTGDGATNELTLISRTGRRYRVTLQMGRGEITEDGYEWTTSQSYELTTDPSTFMAKLSLEENNDDPDAWEIRVARIEEQVTLDGQTQWKVVADVDGPVGQREPFSLIGADVAGNYLLLAALRIRRGSRFGFAPLIFSPATAQDRYRKRTFKLHLTPGTVTAHEGACGQETLSGSADLEWSEEFDADSGIQLPRAVGQWQLSISGQDWTQDSYAGFDTLFFPGSTATVQSATRIRREGTHTWAGRFLVAFDAPDRRGKVLGSEWSKVAMGIVEGQNRAAALALDPPASGSSAFFDGHRLTYEPVDSAAGA
jgi:hypothetical protein